MQDNDISNQVVPRLLIEFEGLVARTPDGQTFVKFAKQFGRWKYVLDKFEFNETVLKVIMHRSEYMHQDIDIITQGPAGFVQAIADWFDNADIRVRSVWSYDPTNLARRVAFMNNVAAVYTPERSHALMYGHKGRYVTEDNITEIGRF